MSVPLSYIDQIKLRETIYLTPSNENKCTAPFHFLWRCWIERIISLNESHDLHIICTYSMCSASYVPIQHIFNMDVFLRMCMTRLLTINNNVNNCQTTNL